MSFRAFAWSVRFFCLIPLFGLLLLILGVNPEGKPWAPAIFLVFLFLTVFGTAAWGLLALYRRLVGEERTRECRRRLMEQAGLLASLSTTLVSLEYVRALVWWSAGLAIVFFFLMELSLRQALRKKQHIT